MLALDAELLASHRCLFGGGTAIVLGHAEYRESLDIDLMVSELEGYRALRERLTGSAGLQAIARRGAALRQATELRADQCGIRTMLDAGGAQIKFEIVREARIAFEAPGAGDIICGVATLTPLDLAATKLLANSDRWADDGVFSRDLIDLAMLAPPKKLLARAIEKARAAYGNAIERDLARAITRLHERRGRLDECMAALQITGVPKAVLWKHIRALRPRKTRR
ncbi:MAG: nucleotidyl transferase AbiEii/AbiGii toxin family protein [Myxococcaceae bacterium]